MFAGKKSAQIREILISESAWEEMTCLFAPSLTGFDPTGGRFVVTADAFGELITANSISTVSVGGSETRPRNVAFNYIVRAA